MAKKDSGAASTGTPAADTLNTDASGACAGGATRLPGTGLCPEQALKLIDPVRVAANQDMPEGCSWAVNETLLPMDEALIYQALSCKGKTTELDFRGGAKTATLGVKQSGFLENVPADHEPVRIVSLFEVTDAKARILDFAREAVRNKAESAACEVRPRAANATDDALVVDANAAYKTKNKLSEGNEPGEGYAACGPYGYTSDAEQFWRVTGDYAFFFDLGQDMPDFNPHSLTVVQKGADGAWAAVK